MMLQATTNPEEKLQREFFVGNTTPEMTEVMLRDFLGRALAQVGLTTMAGNPIVACRVSGKFTFVELRSKEEAAANALNLNNIPYLGAQLRVGRPSKYTGPLTPHGNWEDILAKFMSGELQLNNAATAATSAIVASPSPAAVATVAASASIGATTTTTTTAIRRYAARSHHRRRAQADAHPQGPRRRRRVRGCGNRRLQVSQRG
jgi:hypothetical protein